MATEDSHSYLRTVQRSLAACLVAAAVCGLYDGLGAGGTGATTAVVLGLYGLVGTILGLGSGMIAGAVGQTFGPRALSRGLASAAEDRDIDRTMIGAVVAIGFALVLIAGLVAVGALVLVAGVERKSVGALLLGAVAAASLPVVALASLPVYRVGRRLPIPRLGPMPGFAVLLVVAIGIVALGLVVFVRARLDVEALGLGWLSIALLYPVVAIAWLVASGKLLSGLGQRIPALAGIAVALAVGLGSYLATGTELDAESAQALNDNTSGARVMAAIGRKLSDRDGDGYSARFGGPDCDDSDPNVHPGAKEILDNGKDDNCVGGDRKSTPKSASSGDDQKASPSAGPTLEDANLLIIAIDTLRADRLGVEGYRRDDKSLTPRLDGLVAESAYFKQVYAQAPNTPRSFPSMMASRFPSTVDVDKQFKNYSKILDSNTMLFEVLQAAEMSTIGYSSHFYFTEGRGFRQGFARYDNEGAKDIAGSNKDIASPRIVPKVQAELAKLAASKERFAMFVHLFEPHSTYMKHDEWPITERGVPSLIQKYDYEIAYTDRWLGVILDDLAKTGLADNTVVVVVSDHGEAFGVHRFAGKKMFFHGQTLYDELLRVPLVIRAPGVKPVSIDAPIMLMDLAPTLIDLLGAEVPKSMQGRSVKALIAGESLRERFAYGELLPAPSWKHSAKMVVSGDGKHKLIYRISDRQWELYDLEADPEERKNLYGKNLPIEAELKEELTRWMEVDLAD